MAAWLALAGHAWAGARLHVDEPVYDFGMVMQGQKPEHDYAITNIGDEPLLIEKLESSCGCTAAMATDKTIQPGDTGEIHVAYDSRGKIGAVEKWVTVYTNDAKAAAYRLKITGLVVAQEHVKIATADVLFKGACAECHVNRGLGKKGAALYESDCAMCHEPHSGGKQVAPGSKDMAGRWTWYLRRVTSRGIKDTSMPGFHKKHGGPLTSREIDSVVDYIKNRK